MIFSYLRLTRFVENLMRLKLTTVINLFVVNSAVQKTISRDFK